MIPRGGNIRNAFPNEESTRWHNVLLKYLEKKAEDSHYRNVKVYHCPAP